MASEPYEIYAELLKHLGRGHPLFEPSRPPDDFEVELGDVGYLKNGAFHRLFNPMLLSNDPRNRKYGVPDEFAPMYTFGPIPAMTYPYHIPPGTMLTSRSMRQIRQTEEGSMTVTFECTEDRGAVLILRQGAIREEAVSTDRMERYMRDNIDKWLDFGTRVLNLPLQISDFVFVSGYIKAPEWAIALYPGGGKLGRFSCRAGQALADNAGSPFTPVAGYTAPLFKYGSFQGEPDPIPWATADQCIFLNYYRRKRRLFNTQISASAGPHQLPRGPREDHPGFKGSPYELHEACGEDIVSERELVVSSQGHRPSDCAGVTISKWVPYTNVGPGCLSSLHKQLACETSSMSYTQSVRVSTCLERDHDEADSNYGKELGCPNQSQDVALCRNDEEAMVSCLQRLRIAGCALSAGSLIATTTLPCIT